ncbi:pentapeptide repeat-containing protein [Leptothoe sp. EHU-05/26/07-4]
MANVGHLERLKQGVQVWNQWRVENADIEPDLSSAELRDLNLTDANLTKTNLEWAFLHNSNLERTNLEEANLRDAYLPDVRLNGANLRNAKLNNTFLSGANLTHADFTEADLTNAHLGHSTLIRTKFINASLVGADFTRASALEANFTESNLTGACIQEWNIGTSTNFSNVTCDYFFLLQGNNERRPSDANDFFQAGEFVALVQRSLNTVDLVFSDGIDWQAFFQSFQDLRSQYTDQDLSIQAIEKKRGGAFVVRVEVAEGADKSAIESKVKQLYESQLKQIEAHYEKQLRLQGEQHSDEIQRLIAAERQEKATLMGVLTTMASQQGPKYDFRGAHVAGGVTDKVQGDQIGGAINNTVAEMLSLTEAAAEIQNILKQLETSNTTATEADQMAYLNTLIPPARRERFISALQSSGSDALEDIPYGPVLKSLIEHWQKPEG